MSGGQPVSPPRMGELDALIWALERDPAFRSTIVIVGELDAVPDQTELSERLEAATRRLPRLRQRVAGGLGIAPPRWELDPDFDLGYHMRVIAQPAGTDLVELARPLMMEGFDRSRPLWQAWVVSAPTRAGRGSARAGRRAGLLIKLHHSLTDGMGAVRLASAVFDAERHPPPPPMPAAPDEPALTELGRVWDDVDHDLRRAGRLVRRALPWLLHTLGDAIASPEDGAQRVAMGWRSLRDVAALGVRPLSPVMTGRSRRCHLDTVAVRLYGLRAAGHRAGGTVNDAFLAAVTGGFRRYHDKHGAHPSALRIGIAVDRRAERATAGGDPMGNVFAPVRLEAPLDVPDPSERLGVLHRLVTAAREAPALDVFEAVAATANTLPTGAVSALATVAMRATDVMASNVPGSPLPLYLAGARLQRLVAFGPRAGAAVNLTLLSYAGVAEVGVNVDPAAVPDPETLLACLRAGFDEVLGLG